MSSGPAGRLMASARAEHEAGLEAQAARPVGSRHLLLADRLHVSETYGVGAGAHEQHGLADRDLAGRQLLVGEGERAELEPLTGVRRPRAGSRRAGPDLTVERDSGLAPVDPGVVNQHLGREGQPVLLLRARIEAAELEAVEGRDQQAGAALGEAL